MAQMMRSTKPSNGLLATDGKPHPLQNGLLAVSVVLARSRPPPRRSPDSTS